MYNPTMKCHISALTPNTNQGMKALPVLKKYKRVKTIFLFKLETFFHLKLKNTEKRMCTCTRALCQWGFRYAQDTGIK